MPLVTTKTQPVFFLTKIFLVGLGLAGCAVTPSPSSVNEASTPIQQANMSAPSSTPRPITRYSLVDNALANTLVLRARDRNGDEISLGSGFFIHDGYVATNAHVVADAAWVEVVDLQGRLIATAPYAVAIDIANDLAILPTPHADRKGLPVSETPSRIGDDVWVFGAPLGLEGTTSKGVVAAFREKDGLELLQITAPISRGSSGGPVLNDSGEVIGVATLIMSGGQNLNFAVPVHKLHGLYLSPSNRERFPSSSEFEEAPEDSSSQLADMALAIASAPHIEMGRPYHGELTEESPLLNDTRYYVHQFRAAADRAVQIDGVSNDFDVVMMLSSENGLLGEDPWVLEDDDSGEGTNSRIITVLPTTDTYYLFIFPYDATLGGYTIMVNYLHDDATPLTTDRWQFVGESQNGARFYIDRRTLTTLGTVVTAWVLKELASPAEIRSGASYDNEFILVEFDCEERRHRMQSISYRFGGESVFTEEIPLHQQTWERVPPTTVAEGLLNQACAL